MENEEKARRLDALAELSKLDQELGFDDIKWPENMEIDGLKLVCTSMACPEQYDVFDSSGNKVGYLRLRHGRFRADYPDCFGETVYESFPKGDGIFHDDEREKELNNAIRALKSKL